MAVDTSELEVRTMGQLLSDFKGDVESALKMQNLIYSLFHIRSGGSTTEAIVSDEQSLEIEIDGVPRTVTFHVSDGALTGLTTE